MTAQFTETLFINGQPASMMSTPLGDYFELTGHTPPFQSNCTALWRGYLGTWEIVNDRLYLIELEGALQSREQLKLETLFPGFPDRVFAHWFSGKVRLPQGKRIQYKHMGFGSTYERDLFIVFRKGVVIGQHIVVNGMAPPNATDHTGPNAMTVFHLKNQPDD
jgi:hypothetical protein